MAKKCRFNGLSKLHQLNSLYGYDTLHYLVFDAVHNIPLSSVKEHLLRVLKTLAVLRQLESRLLQVTWPAGQFILQLIVNESYMYQFCGVECRDGRIPKNVTKRIGFCYCDEL